MSKKTAVKEKFHFFTEIGSLFYMIYLINILVNVVEDFLFFMNSLSRK